MAEASTPVFPVHLDLKPPFPTTVDAGVAFKFTIAVESDSGCDLTGAPFRITDDSGAVVASGELARIIRITRDSDAYDPRRGPVDMRDATEVSVTAPLRIGSYAWVLTLPENVIDGIRHETASIVLRFTTKEHAVSLAIWDNPTPVAIDAEFVFKVGAKCSAGCSLTGETIEIIDANGAVVAKALLGDSPWVGTNALYWTTVNVRAPAKEGHFRWSVRMARLKRELVHGGAAQASFSFVATRPAEHKVSIAVFERGTGAPVVKAQVRLGPYRAATDEMGLVRLAVPRGEFRLFIWKDNHEAPEQTVKVNSDLDLRIEANVLPEEDPYSRYWKT